MRGPNFTRTMDKSNNTRGEIYLAIHLIFKEYPGRDLYVSHERFEKVTAMSETLL